MKESPAGMIQWERDVFPVGEGLLDFPGTAFRIRLTFPKKKTHCCRLVGDARPYGKAASPLVHFSNMII